MAVTSRSAIRPALPRRPSAALPLLLVLAACDGGLLGATNRKPVAVAGNDVEAGVGEAVTFDAAGSTDEDGELVAFHWDFGDGADSTSGQGAHAYASAGTYTATLTVTDDRGDDATDTRLVTIVVRNTAPVAEITGPNEFLANTSVAFDGSGSTDPDGTITRYDWDFGDGSVATGAQVSHTFTTAGNGLVKLTVTDDDGATNTAEHTVRIRTAPVTAPANSQWDWDLKNEADRPDGACGPFQAGPLSISITGGSISITEGAGGSSVVYTGTYTAATRAFVATNSSSIITQSIRATFDESFLTFDGRYDVSASLAGCNRSGASGRPILGQRL